MYVPLPPVELLRNPKLVSCASLLQSNTMADLGGEDSDTRFTDPKLVNIQIAGV